MKQYLLDSNAAIELLRNRTGSVAVQLINAGIDNCAVSDITIYELYYGAYCSKNVKQNIASIENFKKWMTVIPSSEAFEEAARQKAKLRAEGGLIEDFDILIGCTAKVSGRALVTDNLKHLSRIEGIQIENWITH